MGTTIHVVAVEPRGIELEVEDGETIMAAAQRCGYRWPTLCRGEGSCSICWVAVTAGEDHLSSATALEQATLALLSVYIRTTRVVRLACQARVRGDVTVHKSGVRPVEPE